MIENHETDKFDNTSFNKLGKGGKLENDRVFTQSFTKYRISPTKFSKNKKLKYVTQYGGVPVGQYGEDILVDSSDSHTLIIGSTGSKKSR